MTPAAWKPILIVVSLLVLLTYLWMQSRSPDLDRRSRLHEALRSLQLHDAELMRDILLARAGLLPHYDALTQTEQELVQLTRQLRDELGRDSSDTPSMLIETADTLVTAFEDKLARVETFKSYNALLRNSVMYFDLAGRTMRRQVNLGAAAETTHVWQAMLSFMETRDAELTQEIQAELDHLAETRALPDESHALVAHGRLIVDVLPTIDVLLRQIIGSRTTTDTNVLQDGLQAYGRQVELRAQRFRLLLYLAAVVLLGYLLYQFARLRSNTLSLRRAHHSLQRETIERQQAEASLRESEERLRAMTESAHEAIVSADSSGHIISWNKGAAAMFGYPVRDVLGTPLLGLFSARDQGEPGQFFAEGHSITAPLELTGVRRDGSEFPLELSLSSWSRGADRYVTAIMRDISARKNLEETARQQELRLIQANKMTALGTLVSGVAHEINNPNQLILMNSGLVADAWSDAQEILNAHHREAGEFSLGGLPYSEMRHTLPVLIHDMHDGAKRIDQIVADLKDFVRPRGSSAPVSFSLNEAVKRAIRLLRHVIDRKTARFQTDLTEPLAALRGEPQQVEQIVVNLLTNALEALPDRPHGVSIATFSVAAERRIGLEVRDEGVGIAPELLPQVCDPFFTTKQVQGGTGLGLAITASLVRAHGGT